MNATGTRARLALLAVLVAGVSRGATIYVTPEGTGSGADWANATSLTNALRIGLSNDAIWLAQGTYTNSATFTVASNGVALCGGFTNGMATFGERDWDAYPAVLDGRSNAWRVVTVTGSGVVLDGLALSNSFGNTTAGGIAKTTSAGPLTLANCRIVKNALRFTEGAGCRFTAGSVLMTNCVVAGNYIPHNAGGYISTGKYGIGIYSSGATLEIVDCVIRDQSADTFDARSTAGGGLAFDNGTLRVLRTEFIGNRGPNNGAGGGAVYLGNNATMAATFRNCVFRANQVDNQGGAGYGGAVWANLNAARTAAFVNCTYAFNTNANGNGGAICVAAGTVTLRNSILWANAATKAGYTGHELCIAGGALRAGYSDLTGTLLPYVFNAGGSATLSKCMTNNPLFASTTDLHVQSASGRWQSGAYVTTDAAHSPCIDAGDPAGSVGAEPSENGGRVNVGSYGGTAQASKSPSAVPQVANRGASAFDYTRMTISGELVNASAVIADVGICYGTENVVGDTTNGWQSVALIYPPQQPGAVFTVNTTFLATDTTYYYRCFAANAFGSHWAAASTFTTGPDSPPLLGVGGGSNVIHVKATAVGEGDGRDWHNAYTKLADAIAAISGPRTNLWITGGTYSAGALLTLTGTAVVVGGFAGTESAIAERVQTNALGVVTNYTAINGEAVHACLKITAAGNVGLDTLSISNSTLPRALEKSGAGVLTLSNCRIEKNALASGYYSGVGNGLGAYFSAGSVFMTNCVIAGNTFPGPDLRYSNYGIGIYASGVILDVVDCLFSNQNCDAYAARTLRGAALAFGGGTCRVARTQFIGNLGTGNGGGGGAVHLGSGATLAAIFSNCVFRGNAVQNQGSGGYGGAVFAELNAARTAAFVNCSFAFNTNANANGQGGAVQLTSGTLILRNCILWTNRASGAGASGHEVYVTGGTLNGSYSDLTGLSSPHVVGGPALPTCMAQNPLFASTTDLHLQSAAGRWDPAFGAFVTTDSGNSPCIDAGDPADAYGSEPMPNGARINMGAYGATAQASKSPPNAPPLVANLGAATNWNRATVSGKLTNDTLVTATVGLCYGTNGIPGDTTNGWQYVTPLGAPQQAGVVFSVTTVALLPFTTYSYRWYATNDNGASWTPVATFLAGDIPPGGGTNVIHVNRLATGVADGSDWVNAYTKISDALVVISGTRTSIWITGGTYSEGVRLSLGSSAMLVGGFAGTETAVTQRALVNALGVVTNYTAINGEGSHGGLRITAGNAFLDALAFTNCTAADAITFHALEYSGTGTLVANNCRFLRNYSSIGNAAHGLGAYFTGGSVLLTNCLVANNTEYAYGNNGFGLCSVGANLQMVDCVVSNNSGDGFATRQSYGCGLYFDNGVLNVLRTDFLGNTGGVNNGSGGGGAVYLGGNANLYAAFSNCVFRGNRALATGAGGKGGAIWANLNSLSKTVLVANCTFADNRNETAGAFACGGAIAVSKGTLVVRNSIFWTNVIQDAVSGSEIHADSASSLVTNSYSCFTGTNAPCVVAANSAVVQWGPGAQTNNPQYASATDVHLKSAGGRWDPATGSRVIDPVTSPCVDAGDPADPVGLEPYPNGRRLNLGAYGGTAQASMTPFARGAVFVVR